VKRWKIVVVLLLCLVLTGAMACLPARSSENEEEFTGQLVEVVRGDLTVSVSGSGFIDVSNEVKLSFDGGGEVDKVYVEEGDEVIEGESLALLVPLDTDALELAVTQAEVALATAEYNLDKAQEIYTKPDTRGAQQAVYDAEDYLDYAEDRLDTANVNKDTWISEVYQAEIDLAKARQELERIQAGDAKEVELRRLEVEEARQALEKAQSDLEIETITAPFDGVVASVDVDEGDVIPPPSVSQVTIIHLIDLTSMELVVELDEIDIPGVERGRRAVIEIDALPELQLEGRVTFVAPVPRVEADVVLYSVKIGFDVPEGSGIKVGMSATADIVLSDRSDVLLVPDRAIKYIDGSPVVYVMVDEQIEERSVVIGLSDGFRTEIKEGLGEGDIVVIEERTESSTPGFPFGPPH